MKRSSFLRCAMLIPCFLIVTAIIAVGEQPGGGYEPKAGQWGKDVIWLPTEQAVMDRMLDMAKVTAQDYLIDLGSGDGRTVISAAKRGARALGIEYNPDLVSLARSNAEREGVADKARFVRGDLFEADLSQATVITMFLLPGLNLRLRPRILALRPGTRIVSNSFDMGDWEADDQVTAKECYTYCTAYLWLVPARVEGTWKLPDGRLMLNQSFQMVSGVFKSGSGKVRISDGRLSGERLSFTAGDTRYTAHVGSNTMEGTASRGNSVKIWSATRTSDVVRASPRMPPATLLWALSVPWAGDGR